MDTTREDFTGSLNQRRYWRNAGMCRPKPPIDGETVEEAIARGCPYTIIEAPVIVQRARPDFVPGAPAPKKPRYSDRWAPGKEFCPPELRYTAEEFDQAAAGACSLFQARTLAALRRVVVDGDTWVDAAEDMGVRDFNLRGRFKRFNSKARPGT